MFARLESDDGKLADDISTHEIVPAWEEGPLTRSEPVPVPCPHCKDPLAKLLPPVGDRDDYSCPICGEFSITGSAQPTFVAGANPRTAKFVLQANGQRWLVPTDA